MQLIRSLYLRQRFFVAVTILVVGFVMSFLLGSFLLLISKICFGLFVAIVFTDLILLYRTRKGLEARRVVPDKLSNGDPNEISVEIDNFYPFEITVEVIDEIPHQFQRRDISYSEHLSPGESRSIRYYLRPVKRGEYSFGRTNLYVRSKLGLLSRRFVTGTDKTVPVYPSFIQMRRYELLAISNRLTETGVKKIRRIGHNLEFEQIKEYVTGDDYRTVNWKATARRSQLMVNHYQDERAQQVFSLIDKGRVMQMPFHGLTLLDYAINASLVISNIAIRKFDKAGLLTFQDNIGTFVTAGRTGNQIGRIMEVLYNQKTAYRETDFSTVYNFVRRNISQRSLLLLYTNFESYHSLERQLPFLKALAKLHLLVVIFFENTEVSDFIKRDALDLRQIYHKAIAEQLMFERKLIVRELKNHGIHSVLTAPEDLSVATINKYLELKARGFI